MADGDHGVTEVFLGRGPVASGSPEAGGDLEGREGEGDDNGRAAWDQESFFLCVQAGACLSTPSGEEPGERGCLRKQGPRGAEDSASRAPRRRARKGCSRGCCFLLAPVSWEASLGHGHDRRADMGLSCLKPALPPSPFSQHSCLLLKLIR